MNGVAPPFTPPSNIVYFHDWRYVDHGFMRWLRPDGKSVGLMPAPDPLPPIHGDTSGLPHGVRIETVPAKVDDEPVFRADALGEIFVFSATVIPEHGQYRIFYESCPPDALDDTHVDRLGMYKYLCIAESDNAQDWQLPAINPRHDKPNMVFDPGPVGYHGGCVYRDEHGPSDERYKTIFLGLVSQDGLDRYQQKWPDDVDPFSIASPERAKESGSTAYGLHGAVSPDGITWKLLEEPLLIQNSDTIQALSYDHVRGKYVAYLRSWLYGRRGVARAESDDFRHFSAAEQVLWPDSMLRPDETWYTSGYTQMPGAPDYHLMFATHWSQWDDSFTPILHASPDGLVWGRVPGRPSVPRGRVDGWCGCGSQVTTLVPLPDGRIGSLVIGWSVPHKYPRRMPGFGQAGWATWERGRITALKADTEGRFALFPLQFHGRRVILNHRTPIAGRIQVAVHGESCYRSFDDCDPIAGDELDHIVTWKGETDLNLPDGEPLRLHFRMQNAELFSVRFH